MSQHALACCIAAIILPSGAAWAQVGTLARQEPTGSAIGVSPALLAEKNANGLPLGGFTFYPKLQVGAAYDDNIYFRDAIKQDDVLFTLQPSVELKSNWVNHSLDLQAYSIDTRYADKSQNDSDQYKFKGDGSLTILRTWVLQGTAAYGHLVQERGVPGDEIIFGRFAFYDATQGSVKLSNRINRLLFTVGVSTNDFRYEDIDTAGGSVDQSYRDHRIDTAIARVDYQYSATTSFFASYSPDRYNITHNTVGFSRSSSGFTVLGGVRAEITRLLKGEVGVGYLSEDFKQPGIPTFSGFNYDVDIMYTPTELTTFSLTANRSLLNSGFAQSPGVLSSQIRLTVEHELTRHITIQLNGEHDKDNYQGVDRSDRRLYLGVTAFITLKRPFTLSPFYKYQTRKSTGLLSAGSNHDNRVGLTLSIAP